MVGLILLVRMSITKTTDFTIMKPKKKKKNIT